MTNPFRLRVQLDFAYNAFLQAANEMHNLNIKKADKTTPKDFAERVATATAAMDESRREIDRLTKALLENP